MIYTNKGPIPRPLGTYVSWSDKRVYIKTRDAGKIKCTTVGQPVDSDTMYPNSNFKRHFPAIWEEYFADEDNGPLLELDVGTFALFLGAAIKCGIYQILVSVLGPLKANALMDYVMYSVLHHSNTVKNMKKKMMRTFLFSEVSYDHKWYSAFFTELGESGLIETVRQKWVEHCVKTGVTQAWFSADGSNFDCEAKNSDLAQKGKAKSGKDVPIIGTMWLICANGKNRGLPLTYHLDMGNRVDFKSFAEDLVRLGDNTVNVEGIILDRGFCFLEVYVTLREMKVPYVIMLREDRLGYQEVLRLFGEEIAFNQQYYLGTKHEKFGITWLTNVFANDTEPSYISLIQDSENGFERAVTLRRKVWDEEVRIREAIKAGKKATVSSDMRKYMTVQDTKGQQVLQVDYDKVNLDCKLKGISGISSDRPYLAAIIDGIYEDRQASEIQYSTIKTQLGSDTQRGHSDENIEGRMLGNFIASIIRATIFQTCKEMKLDTNDAIGAMGSIVLINRGEYYAPVMNLFVPQKTFLGKFGILETHFEKFAEIANERKENQGRHKARTHTIPVAQKSPGPAPGFTTKPSSKNPNYAGSVSGTSAVPALPVTPTTSANSTSSAGTSSPATPIGPANPTPSAGVPSPVTPTTSTNSSSSAGTPSPTTLIGSANPTPSSVVTSPAASNASPIPAPSVSSTISPNTPTLASAPSPAAPASSAVVSTTPTQPIASQLKKNNRGRKPGSKNRPKDEKELDMPKGGRGRPTLDQKRAKEKYETLPAEEKRELLRYCPNYDDLVALLIIPDEQRRLKLADLAKSAPEHQV